MREIHGTWFLDFPDLIRVNQLVRGRVDFTGFESWYASLAPPQRLPLIHCLFECAHQAGVNDSVYEEALKEAGLAAGHALVSTLRGLHRGVYPFGFYELLGCLNDEDLAVAFRLSVYLFGVAEGRVFRNETKACCNHWWHRDLLDERVVQDLLNDPNSFTTSMQDDDRLKN